MQNSSTSHSQSNLKQWKTSHGTVSAKFSKNKIYFYLQNEKEQIQINPFWIKGIKASQTLSLEAAQKFVKHAYIQLSSDSDGNYSLQIHQRGYGGANIINPKTESHRLWPRGIVPFDIDVDKFPVGERERKIILQAIEEFNKSGTGFRLVSRTNQVDFLIFGEEKGKCYSYVGRQGGEQYIRCDLDGGGFNKRSIKHEILHAIGFYHEHQRFDRAAYVAVSGGRWVNYGKTSRDKAFGDYDFNSIMHYHLGGEIKAKTGVIRSGIEFVGTQDRLSEGDLKASNYLAGYAKTISSTSTSSSPETSTSALFIPAYEKMERIAYGALYKNNLPIARKYFLELYKEYKDVLPKPQVANWCFNYGYCCFHMNDLEQAKIGTQKSLEYQSTSMAEKNFRIIQEHIKSQKDSCTLI